MQLRLQCKQINTPNAKCIALALRIASHIGTATYRNSIYIYIYSDEPHARRQISNEKKSCVFACNNELISTHIAAIHIQFLDASYVMLVVGLYHRFHHFFCAHFIQFAVAWCVHGLIVRFCEYISTSLYLF